nr:MAG TPA: hypothetical protein [Caudoviricetes sp.]DAZ45997.1 MAG TPA: hypothetical protein [Caudoviricetes sp.]
MYFFPLSFIHFHLFSPKTDSYPLSFKIWVHASAPIQS